MRKIYNLVNKEASVFFVVLIAIVSFSIVISITTANPNEDEPDFEQHRKMISEKYE